MSGTRYMGTAALVAALILTAPAYAQLQSAPGAQPPQPASAAGQAVTPLSQIKPTNPKPIEATTLSPIEVIGHKIYLPVALEMIKAALKRPESFAPEDMGKLVCQFGGITGSHFNTLHCATNCQLWVQHMATQGVGLSTQNCGGSGRASTGFQGATHLAATIVGWSTSRHINPGALKALLAKLPPAGSSYTLQVTDHGKVTVKYVLKDGEVVKVLRTKRDRQ